MALAALILGACRQEGAAAEAVKPTIHVLTSLPLLFDEGFGLAPASGPAATYLRQRYTLKPIDLPSQLPPGAVLLAAQPRALPAEELVALDAWVRGGGRLLLLADPLLEWPSERALGDRLRPPISFADTGLLGHWGLRLDAPDRRGLRSVGDGGPALDTLSPGTLVQVGGACMIEPGAIVAHCRIGRGRATIVADVDFLNVAAVEAVVRRDTDNLAMLERQLSQLRSEAK